MRGTPPPNAFVPQLRLRAATALRELITPMPGVRETLNGLSIPFCVASNGELDKIRLTLGATGLLQRFEGRIFSVADVGRPKPAPDIYLLAAQRLGVLPARCAVVEDTPTGVLSARAACMHVFGYAANTPGHRLSGAGAHQLLSDLRDLPGLLAAG